MFSVEHNSVYYTISGNKFRSYQPSAGCIRPHLVCLSKHMREQEIINFSLSNYGLASSFCRKDFQRGEYVS